MKTRKNETQYNGKTYTITEIKRCCDNQHCDKEMWIPVHSPEDHFNPVWCSARCTPYPTH